MVPLRRKTVDIVTVSITVYQTIHIFRHFLRPTSDFITPSCIYFYAVGSKLGPSQRAIPEYLIGSCPPSLPAALVCRGRWRAAFVVKDSAGQKLSYVYFEDEPSASLSNKTGWCDRATGHSASA
jgi:hypothetical protein